MKKRKYIYKLRMSSFIMTLQMERTGRKVDDIRQELNYSLIQLRDLRKTPLC